MLPIVNLEGPPRAQGLAHGRALRARIAHNIAVYFDRFESEGRIDREEVLRRADSYWNLIRDTCPDYAEGVVGIAEGAGLPLEEIVALNVRYEILYSQFAANAMIDGCTSFAALPPATADGKVFIGQNWDWIPQVAGALVHTRGSASSSLAFTEAGIFGGKIGLNSAGLGLAINGLTSVDDDWSTLGTPFHVRCREILRSSDPEEAVRLATDAPRSCSANFVIAHHRGWAASVETAPAAVHVSSPEEGALAHANHFLCPDEIGVQEPPNPRRPGSLNRLAQMRRLLDEGRPLDADTLRSHLRDHTGHPDSVCRHPDPRYPPAQHYESVVSVVMDLTARTMWISDGPPCGSAYQSETV